MNVAPIKDIKKIGEHMNEFKLIETVKNLHSRVLQLEKEVFLLKGGKKEPKVKKELSRMGNYEPYIAEILADGRIYSVYSIEEEIKKKYPSLPYFDTLGVQNACLRLHKVNRLEKIANSTYRKKNTLDEA